MNRSWASFALLSAIGLMLGISPPFTSADAVYCTNCGTEWTQLLNKATMLKQLAQQAQQLKVQIGQYQDMITNSKGVSQHLWGNIQGDFQKLNALLQQSRALSYSAGNLDSQFAQRYPGYSAYSTGRINWRDKYSQWSRESGDNALYTMKAAQIQHGELQDENALMQRLQTMSQTSQGRMEALQIANMIAAQNVGQIQKLRQLVMSQLQMQANYYQMLQDKEDAAQAAHERFVNSPAVPSNDGRKF